MNMHQRHPQRAIACLLLLIGMNVGRPLSVVGTGSGRPPERPPERPPRRSFVEPAACATKAVFHPREPSWVFVMNFETIENGQPIGCLKLFRDIVNPSIGPTDYRTAPCKVLSNGSNVVFHDGQTTLTGGYIYCDVNIRATLATLTPPGIIAAEENYRYYTIISVAALSNTAVLTTYSNPVGYYQPDNPDYPVHGLFLPFSDNGVNITSLFNGVVNSSFTNTVKASAPYTFTAEHDGGYDGSTVYSTTHWLGETLLDTFAPRERVKVWTDGGAFLIGGSFRDLAHTFQGTLEEVIFDPTDIGRPPASSDPGRLWLPLLNKQ